MSFRLTLILSFLFFLNTQTGRVFITLYALKLGAQPFMVGAMAAMFSVLPTLLSWRIGRINDRFGSRWLLMIATAAGFLGTLTTYVIPSLPALCITSVFYGLGAALYASPLQNLVGLLSKPEDRAKNFSNYSLVFSFTSFAGPLVAGFSFDHTTPDTVCLALMSMLLVPIAMLVAWGGTLPGGAQDAKPAGSVRELLSESGLWRALAVSSLVVTGFDLFQIYIPVYGHGIGLSASAIGIILGMCSLAAFAVRIILPALISRLTAERLLAYSFLIGAAGFLLVPLFKNVVLLSLISFFFGISIGCGAPITLLMTFSGSAKGRSGEAMGLRITANNLMRVISQTLLGSITSVFGVFSVFCINALMYASGWALSHPRIFGQKPEEPKTNNRENEAK